MARKRVVEAPSLHSWEDVNDALRQIAEAQIALGEIQSDILICSVIQNKAFVNRASISFKNSCYINAIHFIICPYICLPIEDFYG